MPNFKLDELLTKTNEEIRNIAHTLGLNPKPQDSQQDIAYSIIDEQGIRAAQNATEERRPRRRRIGEKKKEDTASPAAAVADSGSASVASAANEAQPQKRRRGRPRKEETAAKAAEALKTQPQLFSPAEAAEPAPPKRRRGRPRKEEVLARQSQSAGKDTAKETAPIADQSNSSASAPASVSDDSKAASAQESREQALPPKADYTDAPSSSEPSYNNNVGAESGGAAADEPAGAVEAANAPSASSTPGAYAVTPPMDTDTDFIIVQDIPPLDYDVADAPYQPHTRAAQPQETPYYPAAAHDADQNTAARQQPSAAYPEHTPTAPRTATVNTAALFGDNIVTTGVLEITPDGQGFLRSADFNYLPSPDDVFVANQQIKFYGLKMGDVVEGPVRPPKENDKYFTLLRVNNINGLKVEQVRDRVAFEHLTPLFPDEKFRLCKGDGTDSLSARIVDLFAPIGKGQRALLVAQPKTGKTVLMKTIANAIAANHPEAYLMMLLIDERPEEVTDMARTVNAEVIASTFDEPAANHVRIAGIVLEKAKRMVECGHDVVIFLDSITRLARAYNTVAPASGKILTGGVDANALQKPKRFFGAARNIEGGGSLTIVATALIDTGSKMDEVIFEEFKGTGNMELQLDRSLANKRIFPAVNVVASSTRRDDLLQDENTLNRMWVVRNHIAEMTPMESMTFIRDRLEKTRNNQEFLISVNS